MFDGIGLVKVGKNQSFASILTLLCLWVLSIKRLISAHFYNTVVIPSAANVHFLTSEAACEEHGDSWPAFRHNFLQKKESPNFF